MTKQPLKILIVLDSRAIGGIETHVYNIAKGLKERNHLVSVVLLKYHTNHPLISSLGQYNIPVIALDGRLKDLVKAIQYQSPDLIHTHGYKAGIVGRFASKVTQTVCVSTFHNGDLGSGKLRLYTALDLWTSKYSTNIAVSKEIACRLKHRCAAVLPNFISVNNMPSSPKGRQIAFVGRLESVKNPTLFCQLALAFQGDEFHIYGDGSQRAQLEKNSPENIYFHGAVNDISCRWALIDVLIIPSLQEGLPLAALEAMAHDVPVIASAVGDLPELIEHNSNGFLFDGSLSQLQSTLQGWFDLNDESKKEMRFKARKTVTKGYSNDAILPKTLAIYDSALSSQPSRGIVYAN
jgi:glycosyltransferase involved in cell wall biosynthesis